MILGVAMVALDRLVEQRPCLVRELGRHGRVAREEQECGEAHRGGVLVEERRLGTVERAERALAVELGEHGERVEHLPAGLRFGAVERVDKGIDMGLEELGRDVRNCRDLEADFLATAPARAGKALDERLDKLGRVDGSFLRLPGSFCSDLLGGYLGCSLLCGSCHVGVCFELELLSHAGPP